MNSRFKRILAALDRSPAADSVFWQSLSLAQQHYGQLKLMHCVSLRTLENWGAYVDAGAGLASPDRLRRLQDLHLDEVNAAWQWLCNWAELALSEGVTAEIICVTGDACSQICRVAREWEPDLLLLGHGGKAGLRQQLFGSTTTQVVLHAPCSVMAVRPSAEPPHQSSRPGFQTVPQTRSLEQDKRLVRAMWNYAGP